jgi:hypothetical protein
MTRSFDVLARGAGLAGWLLVGGGAAAGRAQSCSEAGLIGSTVTVLGLAVFDIATAPASARLANQASVTIAPYVNPHERAYGVSVSWAFRKSMPAPPPVRRLPAAVSDSARVPKSPGAAFVLSFISTAGPMAAGAGVGSAAGAGVFLAGVVVGPSVGHFYAGRVGRGLATAGVRAAGVGWFVASIAGCAFD